MLSKGHLVGLALLAAGLALPGDVVGQVEPQSPAPAIGGDAPAADTTLRGAVEAIRANHLPEAHRQLDRLRAQNAGQSGLWSAYGVLSLRENDSSAAVTAFRRELANHPETPQVYAPLVSTLVASKRIPEALDALRAWSAAVPADPQPVELLVNLLLENGQTAEAIRAGEDGLSRLPEAGRHDVSLQGSLAAAELKGGDKAAGARRMVAALQLTNDASARNSMAYALAEAGAELPVAEAAERGVVSQLELESEGWSLDGDPAVPLFGTRLLSAAWDTLGWILFKEGKPAEAEPLVRASWRNDLHPEVAGHLTAIQGVRRLGQTPSPREAASELQRLRAFPLGPAAGRSGSATYRVLLARGRVRHGQRETGDLTGATAESPLARADVSALFPASGTYVQLVHRVTVHCRTQGCEMVLLP